jgi:hypothetical protein
VIWRFALCEEESKAKQSKAKKKTDFGNGTDENCAFDRL